MADREGPKSRRDQEPNPYSLFGVGFEFAGAVGGLTLVGWWLDRRWQTQPWLMCLGMTIGVIGGIYKIWRLGKRFF